LVIWGTARSFPEGLPPGTEAPTGFALIHLWFLYYLVIFYALALVVRAGFGALDANGVLRSRLDAVIGLLFASRPAPLALALPAIAVLFCDPSVPLWFGIPTPEYGLVPKLPALVALGTAFWFGWMLHRQVALVEALQRQWLANITLAIAFTVACLAIIGP